MTNFFNPRPAADQMRDMVANNNMTVEEVRRTAAWAAVRARRLAETIRAWLSNQPNQWGEPGNDAIEFKLTTQTDAELMEALFHAGVARLHPYAGRAEIQVVLDAIREEYRLRAKVGAVEMERRRREAEWR